MAGSPQLYKKDGDWSSVYSSKKGEVAKIVYRGIKFAEG